MSQRVDHPGRSRFRYFFWRGLGIILPTALTIWIVIAAYGFIQQRIAGPINAGTRQLVVLATPYPSISSEDVAAYERSLRQTEPGRLKALLRSSDPAAAVRRAARMELVTQQWNKYRYILDFWGLISAILLIYVAGLTLGSFIGGRLMARGEDLLQKVPLIGQVYPSVKQVTDFLVGGEPQFQFNRVVAVEYPRRGLWSLGLVTGDTMRQIQEGIKRDCLTVFVPSSPTPFTGYVVTVPREETIDLDISIDDALRFTISGGVIVPPAQRIIREAVANASNSVPAPDSRL